MSELTANKEKIMEKMFHKLLNDPDKYERMFAAQYLAKYDFSASKSVLISVLNDEDREVVNCITCLLKKQRGTSEATEAE